MLSGVIILKDTVINPNYFFQEDGVPAPVISQKATITSPQLRTTFLYDLPTQKGKIYTLKFN